MATTPKGIYYPNDYNEIADIPEDMKKMAESIEEVFEDTDSDLSDIKEEQTTQNNRLNSLEVDNTTNKSDILTNKQEINNIKQEQTTQNTNISNNATNIESLQKGNESLKKIVSQLPQVEGQGTEVTLENTIEAPFTKFDVEGNSTQDGTPSPETQVPIKCAGDNGTINEKINNKNVAWNNLGDKTISGLTFAVNEDKSITANGTATSDVYYVLRNDLSFKAGETWSLSGCNGGSSTTYGLYCYNIGDLYNGTKTTTLTSDFVNRQLGIIVKSGTTLNNVTFYPQLELNSQATDYVPPQEQDYSIFVQQPMRSIGDVRDCFVKKSDGWYERHYIGRVIFDGTEEWGQNGSTASTGQYVIATTNKKYGILNLLSNSFVTKQTSTENSIAGRAINRNIYITIDLNIVEFSVAKFKAYLAEKYTSGNPVYVDYELETPLDLPCTQSQIDVLENKPSTYKDFTIINSEDETEAYLEVSGIYDLNKLITRVEVIESEV